MGADLLNDVSQQHLLEKGATLTAICYGINQIMSIVYVLFIPALVKKIDEKIIFGIATLIGGLGLVLSLLTHSFVILIIGMLGLGMMVAATNAIPYITVTREIGKEKMGLYLGVFNITITVPQIIAGLLAGVMSQHLFHNDARQIILLAGWSIAFGGLIALGQLMLKSKK